MMDDHILQDSDIPFAERLNLREHALTWISRDIGGIRNFVFPKAVVDYLQLTRDQVESSLRKILDEFFIVSTPLGKETLNRALACEHTAHLRHCVLRLRRNELTHHDAVQYAIMLESLWDSINTEMPDAVWARCSFHFDTALISLRIVHLLLYLRQEFPANLHKTEVRAAMFNKIYKSCFDVPAPTDDKHDKHSTHFKSLLAAWKGEFGLYAADNFEEKLRSLEHHHGNVKTAEILDQFIRQVQVDDGWMLRAYQLEADYSAGKMYRRTDRRRSSASDAAVLPAPQPVEDLDELEFDEKEDEEDKDENDEDYDYNSAVANSIANSDDEETRLRRVRRVRPSGTGIRKSPRISRGIARARRTQLTSRLRRSGIRHIKEEEDEVDDYVLPILPSKRQASYSRRKQDRTVTILKDVSDSPVLYEDDEQQGDGDVVDDGDEPVAYGNGVNNAVRRALAADARAAAVGNTRYREDVVEEDAIEPTVGAKQRRSRRSGRGKNTLASVPRRSGLRNMKENVVDGDEASFDDASYHPDIPPNTNDDPDDGEDGTADDDTIDREQILGEVESTGVEVQVQRRIGFP